MFVWAFDAHKYAQMCLICTQQGVPLPQVRRRWRRGCGSGRGGGGGGAQTEVEEGVGLRWRRGGGRRGWGSDETVERRGWGSGEVEEGVGLRQRWRRGWGSDLEGATTRTVPVTVEQERLEGEADMDFGRPAWEVVVR